MADYQKRLLALAIDSLYVPDRECHHPSRILPATIYKGTVTLRTQVHAILQKLGMTTVDMYIAKCHQTGCLPWPGYKSRGYPQIKIKHERFTVTQILALLFLNQSPPPLDGGVSGATEAEEKTKLQRSCDVKSCVNILHYSYVATERHGQKDKTQEPPL